MIATKFGLPGSLSDKILGSARRLFPSIGSEMDRYSAAYGTTAIEHSLRRLATDYLDVALVHSPSTKALRDGEWVGALSRMRERGTIRFYGVSASTSDDATFAIQECGVDVVQVELNACTLADAGDVFKAAAVNGSAVVARQVFGSGKLLGDIATRLPDVARTAIATSLLHRVLDNEDVSLVLVGTRKAAHLDALVGLDRPRAQLDKRIVKAALAVCADRVS
jgi:aryl-alcohol dehydrogenase-like predicted oxidoreductase